MKYPLWVNLKLWKRLVSQREIAGKPMSKATQRAAIAKLRKLVRTGQSQEKILYNAINGISSGIEENKPPNTSAYKINTLTIPEKSKDIEMVNDNLSDIRKALR